MDTPKTILGLDDPSPGISYEREDSILDYALSREFTEILLYDVEKVLDNPIVNWGSTSSNQTTAPTYLQHLVRFITKAKASPYNFTVSVWVSDKDHAQMAGDYSGLDDYWYNYQCVLEEVGNSFMGVNGNYSEPEDEVPNPQIDRVVNTLQRIHNYNTCWIHNIDDISVCDANLYPVTSCDPTGMEIDRIVFEMEWWTAGALADAAYENFEWALKYAYTCIKPFSVCPLSVDSYVGHFNSDTYDDDDQVEHLELYSDRIFVTGYSCLPENAFDNMHPRLNLIGLNGISHSNVWPLFSAESICLSNPNAFLGDFLAQGGTMACVEDLFATENAQECIGCDNDINGFGWFTSNVMFNNSISRKKNIETIEGFQVTPNPSSNNVSVRFPESDFNSEYSILIYDAYGKMVFKANGINKEHVIDLTELNNGVYTIKSIDNNGQLFQSKFVKN